MRAILWQIAPHCQSVMVSGIDDHGILQRVLPFNFGAMQEACGLPSRQSGSRLSYSNNPFLRPCLRPGNPTLKAGGLMTLSLLLTGTMNYPAFTPRLSQRLYKTRVLSGITMH